MGWIFEGKALQPEAQHGQRSWGRNVPGIFQEEQGDNCDGAK